MRLDCLGKGSIEKDCCRQQWQTFDKQTKQDNLSLQMD